MARKKDMPSARTFLAVCVPAAIVVALIAWGFYGESFDRPRICPTSCYLYQVGVGSDGVINVNCDVKENQVHQPLDTCIGKESYSTVRDRLCSCRPVDVVPDACPMSCGPNSECQVDAAFVGEGGVPCEGHRDFAQGTSKSCVCVLRNGNWTAG